jgi:hypothetical protein
MRAGEALRVAPPISPRLSVMLPRVRDIFHTWWPHLSRVDLDLVPDDRRSPASPARAATFFSGGVDSFYTLLRHHGPRQTLPAPMTHLIFMRGVETRLEGIVDIEKTEQWVREIAARVSVQPIFGETNFRTVLQGPAENLHWERHYHGSALAAIALGLSPGMGYVCVPSTFSYNHVVAYGSTPLVDEMFSTEHLQVLHDGADAPRPIKLARILEWDRELVLDHLRVCILNRGGAFNCGHCRKCVRTAVPLRVLGAWQEARTFPEKSTDHWERVIADDHLEFTEENLQFARDHGADQELLAMLGRAIRRKKRQTIVKGLFSRPPLDRARPAALRAARLWRAYVRA